MKNIIALWAMLCLFKQVHCYNRQHENTSKRHGNNFLFEVFGLPGFFSVNDEQALLKYPVSGITGQIVLAQHPYETGLVKPVIPLSAVYSLFQSKSYN